MGRNGTYNPGVEAGWIVAAGVAIACAALAVRLARATQDRDAAQRSVGQLAALSDGRAAEAASAAVLLNGLAEACIDPILILNEASQIVLANRAAVALFPGARAGESMMGATRSAELDDIARDVGRDEYEFAAEITLSGRLFRVYASKTPADAPRVIVILRDISELQRLGRARRDFVANISHELRTPLQAMQMLIDGARLRPEVLDAREGRAAWTGQFEGQVAALAQMTQELYDLSQIESGLLPMALRPERVRDIADAAIAVLAPQAERAGLTLANDVPENTIALVDATQIQRVLANLLHNAIKFTEQGGVTVLVDGARPPGPPLEGAWIVVGVRDTGPGISRGDQGRIFERFYKADRARGKGGSGLGLAIARHIVERHGGKIWVDGVPGRGSTFYFALPATGMGE